MAPSPQIQMLCHTARTALSRSRRRVLRPPSSAHPTRDVHKKMHQHQHQRRHLTSTPPLYAQPHKFVTGVTSQQLDENKAMRDWYAANFEDWQEEPDKIFVSGEEDKAEEEVKAAAEEEENLSAITLPKELVDRNIRPLVAYLRKPGHEEGTRNCNRMRNPGVNDPNFPLVPGMLHGSNPTRGIVSVDASSKIIVKTPWFEIQRELDRYHHGINGSFENRVYALTVFPSDEAHLDHHRGPSKDLTTYHVDGDAQLVETPGPAPPAPPPRAPVEGMENILVVPADLQMHPVAHAAFCLNFIRYHPGKPIKIAIRLVNEEESPTLKRGGFLGLVNRSIECLVEEGVPIPECIELECAGLKQKDVVRRDRLTVPEGVTIHPRVPDDYLMGTVYGIRAGTELDEGETEGEGGEEEKK